eukprot:CAMPEP_0182424902 /NCGR_PEP_ID=MMETSP1167-20130531/11176_1 /TAXON_ID=2988 /ORGANISM="Mallomonas Sp, Strain CCMP3275" /LENGTH=1098 /DNA_ID=CAMNT_0024605071 /DNA_START=247 /DNA_END=3543 /DNA_ORIENTATION=+
MTQDAAADKYDYMIVFDTLPKNERQISFEDAKQYWTGVIPGTDDMKKQAVNHMKSSWDKYNNPELAWKTVVKDTIIDQLSARSGLQLHKTSFSDYVFCRVRAPIKLLEMQAKREGYQLQFRGEIDPGSAQFWNISDRNKPQDDIGDTPELEEDRKQYSKDDANQILGRLHRAGKISPIDMSVNAVKETKRNWSRRVHALERIADKVPVWNTYPAYVPFAGENHLRYLFQTYPSVRGKTLFRSKDRLYLTKAIIDKYFDMGRLVEDGYVEAFMALHDANRGEALTTETLQKRWTTFWSSSCYEVGSPLVTDEAYEEDKAVWWYLRPFSQPLINIREYMGEKVALHFAWLGCYTYNMLLPSIIGSAFAFYQYSTGYSESQEGINTYQIAFLVFLVFWSVSTRVNWNKQETAISLKWGTHGFEAEEKDRPQFKPYDSKKPFKRSVINNRKETYFPDEKRRSRQVFSIILVLISVITLIGLVGFVYYVEHIFKKKGYIWGSPVCSTISATQIVVLSYFYGILSRALNDWENHRTETAYEDSLIFKTFSFEIFNYFLALMYTSFIKGNIFHDCTNNDCVADLKMLLLALYMVRYGMYPMMYFQPMIMKIIEPCIGRRKIDMHRVDEDGEADPSRITDMHYILEFGRQPDMGTYDMYAKIVLQYGYLVMFASAWPLIFVMSLFDNMIAMRMNAWKQCVVLRRPHVQLAEDAGMWTDIMELLTVLGVYFNVAIFVWTGRSLESRTMLFKMLFFFVASQTLLLTKTTLEAVMDGLPTWIKDIEARQRFIEKKYMEGGDDGDDNLIDKSEGAVLPDEVDVDGMSLYDFRGAKMTKADMRVSDELEKKRRRIQNELLSVKNQLETAYSTETFNAQTGVGETKEGIPLGLLKIYVLRWVYTCDDASFATVIPDSELSLQASIRYQSDSISVEQQRIPVCGPASNTRTQTSLVHWDKSSSGLLIEFRQALGPFAAIRTMHAEVLFELVLVGHPDIVVATAIIPLFDLSDQKMHEVEVHMDHVSDALKVKIDKDVPIKMRGSDLHVSLQMQYSKIVPLRERIVQLQEDLVRTEQYLSMLKSGQLSRQETETLSDFLKTEKTISVDSADNVT